MDACFDTNRKADAGFQLSFDALITVDERGQMVLPKDVRKRLNIQPGEKLALVSCDKEGEMCCMSLIKTDVLSDMVKDFIGPIMGALDNQ